MTLPDLSKYAQVILDNLADGIILTDHSLQILYCNHYASQVLAFPENEILGKSLVQFISSTSWLEKLSSIKSGREKDASGEDFIFNHTGSVVTVRWSVNQTRPLDDAQSHLLFQLRDVSTETKMREALDFAEFTLSSASIGIYWIDEQARFVYINDAACESLGYTREELLQMKVLDIDPHMAADKWKEHWAATRKLPPRPIERVHQRKDGTQFPVEIIPHYFEHNGYEYHITTSQDITERKKAEAELVRHREHLTALVDERTRELRAINRQLTEEVSTRKRITRDLAEQRKQSMTQFKAVPIPIYVWQKSGDEFLLIDYNDAAYMATSGMVKDSLNATLPDLFGNQPDIIDDMKRCWVRQERIEKEISLHFPHDDFMRNLIVTYIPVNPDMVMVFNQDITQRKLAMAKVEASEQRYRAVFDASNDALIIGEMDKLYYSNPAFLKLFGYTDQKQVAYLTFMSGSPEFQPSGERSDELGLQYIKKAYQEGNCRFVWLFQRANGEQFLASVVITVFQVGEQKMLHVSIRDITEQERAARERQEALARREELERIINRSQTYAFLWRNEDQWPVEYASANIANFGYTLEDFTSGRIAYNDLIHPEDLPQIIQEVADFSADLNANILHQEYRLRTADGHYHWVDDNTFPRRNEVGAVTHFEGILQDITERKLIAEELRRSWETAAVLLNNAHDMVMLIDKNGTILSLNQKALEAIHRVGHHDLTMKDIIGRNIYATMPGNLVEERKKRIKQAMKNGEALTFMETAQDDFIYDTSIKPIVEPDGSIERIAVFVHDISALVIKERELRQALEDAQQAEEVKSQFLSHMSHEIRTPLNHVIGLSSLLLMEPEKLNVETRKYLKIINRSGESLLSIINTVLDLSKIETGKMQAVQEQFNIFDFLQEIGDRFSLLAESDALQFALTVDPRLPGLLIGDSFMLSRILDNLLSNAIKFTPVGKIGLNVSIHERNDRSVTLLFAVRDTGIGIPREEFEKIFQSFYQVDGSANRDYQGTGLGLTITQEFVKLMGGRIWLESEPGKGSGFFFTCRFEL
ncbi:MAG TPA: PAS domain S-box protein [bacterium]|nr:PAS domain S-box protein [bacterium]